MGNELDRSTDMGSLATREQAKAEQRKAHAELARLDNEAKDDQDNQDTAEPSGLRVALETGRELWSGLWTQTLPWWPAVGVLGLAIVARELALPTRLVALVVAVALATAALRYTHCKLGKTGAPWLHAQASAAAAVVFTGWVTVTGSVPLLVFIAGFVALAVPYWRAHFRPMPDITAEQNSPEPEPVPEPEPEPLTEDQRVYLWNLHMGVGTMTGITEFAYGWRATVEMPIGKTYKHLQDEKQRDHIATIYGLGTARVFPESVSEDAPMNLVRLTLLTINPLKEVAAWEGPTLDPVEGTFPLMIAADGDRLLFRFWTPGDGATHALFIGTTRSGKSNTLNVVMAEAMCSDRLYPVAIDLGPVSLTHWIDNYDIPAATTLPDARELLTWLFTVMKKRVQVLRRIEGDSITPSPELPGIVVFIDEAHNLLMEDKVICRKVERLAQEGAKYGISLVMSTQSSDVSQLGGSITLRNMLKSGTVVGHRSTEAGEDNKVATGDAMPERLRDLPSEWPDGSPTRGLGYMMTSRKIRARSLLMQPRKYPDLPAWVTRTPLDRGSAVALPDMPGETDDDEGGEPGGALDGVAGPRSGPVVDTQALEEVQAVVRDTGETDPVTLAARTGLPLAQVITAVAELS